MPSKKHPLRKDITKINNIDVPIFESFNQAKKFVKNNALEFEKCNIYVVQIWEKWRYVSIKDTIRKHFMF